MTAKCHFNYNKNYFSIGQEFTNILYISCIETSQVKDYACVCVELFECSKPFRLTVYNALYINRYLPTLLEKFPLY